MNKWLRRIRGAIGMGLTWGLAWLAAGIALLLVVGPDAADVPFPLGFGMLGFFSGVTFSGVLGLIEGRRRFDQMSLPRFAGWGPLGDWCCLCSLFRRWPWPRDPLSYGTCPFWARSSRPPARVVRRAPSPLPGKQMTGTCSKPAHP